MSETAEQQDPKPEEVVETAAAEAPVEAEPPIESDTTPEAEAQGSPDAEPEAPVEPGSPSAPLDPPEDEPSEPAPAELSEEVFGIETKPEADETAGDHLRAVLEAVIYVTDEPLSAKQIADALGQPVDRVEKGLAELTEAYAKADRGLSIREIAGGYKMSTKPEFHEEIRAFVKKLKPPLKLSLAALETLAVIAYKQPITGPEIMEIRGVQGGGVLKTLLDRKLITTSGRKQVVGRPVLYKTTKDFLVQFGLKDLAELPSLKEFEEWSRLALGADEPEAPEPAPTPETPPAAAADAAPAEAPEATAEAPAEPSEPQTEPPAEPAAEPPAADDVPAEPPAPEPETTEPPQESS